MIRWIADFALGWASGAFSAGGVACAGLGLIAVFGWGDTELWPLIPVGAVVTLAGFGLGRLRARFRSGGRQELMSGRRDRLPAGRSGPPGD